MACGRWKEIKTEIVGGDIPAWMGTKNTPVYLFEFEKDGACIDFSFDPRGNKVPYRVDEGILYLGRLQFRIQTLNSTELVLVTYDPKWPNAEFERKHVFKREKLDLIER